MSNSDLINKLLGDITTNRTYAKHLTHLGRREVFSETVNRNMNMHLDRFPKLSQDILKAYQRVHNLQVMPSMRALQFGGEAINKNELRQYNCSFLNIDSVDCFGEILFLLLSGVGVGFSVQNHHIKNLPVVKSPKEEGFFVVQDSIMGWAQALSLLMESYFFARIKPQFDFGNIRPKGSYLVTTGAKAPGPEPLKKMLEMVESQLKKAQGRKLTDLEIHDIVCIISDCVLAGGIRRAALISLFDRDSVAMLKSKHGEWWNTAPWRARANNSAVLPRDEVTKEEFNHIFKMCKESGSGEPGIFWTANKDHGTNPSLRKGTRVLTKEGVFPIEELESKSFIVPNLNGEWSEAKCWLSGRDIPLWELTLDTGEKYYASPEHQWPIYKDGQFVKCESQSLKDGDLLPVNVFKREELFSSGTMGTRDQGFLIGWLYGDGSITVRSDTQKRVCSFIVSPKGGQPVLNRLLSEIHKIDGVERKVYERKQCFEFQASSPKFIEWLETMTVDKKEFGLPSGIWTTWSEECRRGFIDGLFSSDGHVPKDSHGVSISSSKEKLAKDVQDLLGFYGIKSNIFLRTTNGVFPNGKDYNKTYTNYVVRTTRQGRRKFAELFDLSVEYKQQELKKSIPPKQEFVKLKSIKLTDLKEDVWDISVKDDTHCFHLPQVTTGNCCEIALNSNQLCNLTTINQTGVTTEKDFMNRVYAATLIGTIQATYTNFDYVRPIWQQTTEREALLGVSFTGIADNPGFFTPELLAKGAKFALEVNEKYAKKLGINPAARVTTVKPEGSSSCVLGSSSGIHARHSQYYLRRVRMNKSDALAVYLKGVMPELVEDDKFSSSGVVVTIPQKSPEGSILRENETAFSLLDRTLMYRKNWIENGHRYGDNHHNVSVTISVKENEWDELREKMWEERNNYSGISLLPYDGGTYVQAPFEECTKEQYEETCKLVKDVDLKLIKEETDTTNRIEIIACAGGACEIT